MKCNDHSWKANLPARAEHLQAASALTCHQPGYGAWV